MSRTTALLLASTMIGSISACSLDITTESPLTTAVTVFNADGMDFTASVERVTSEDRTIKVTVRVQNRSESAGTTSILGGNCMIMVRLYDGSNGETRWSQFDEVDACQEPLKVFDLAPGEEETVSTQVTVDVGSGTYFVTATIEHLDAFPTNYVELVAGNVTLP